MARKRQKTQSNRVLTLPELLQATQHDVHQLIANQVHNERVTAELEADLLVILMRWVEAGQAYQQLQLDVWRVKEKLAYCQFQQKQLAESLANWRSGPARQSPIAHCVHAFCLLDGKRWVPDSLRSEIKALLRSALREICNAPAEAFDLLDRYYLDGSEDLGQRVAWLTDAVEHFPRCPDVLVAYARLSLIHPFASVNETIQRLLNGMDGDTHPKLVWLTYRIALRAQHETSHQLHDWLYENVNPRSARWLTLAIADEHIKRQDWEVAGTLIAGVERDGPELHTFHDGREYEDWEIVACAVGAQLAIALIRGDSHAISDRAAAFAEVLRHMPNDWRGGTGLLLREYPHPFWIGGELFDYQSSFDLQVHRDQILAAVGAPDIRGCLRLIWAHHARDDNGDLTDDGIAQIDLAATEWQHPLVDEARYEVARLRGQWRAAGEALTRFEIYRHAYGGNMSSLVSELPLDDVRKTQVRDFVQGFRQAVRAVPTSENLEGAVSVYAQGIRAQLLKHKLHDEMLDSLTDLKAHGASGLGFDLGLANDYLKRYGAAKAAYWTDVPDLSEGAIKNLLRIAEIENSDVDLIRLEQQVAAQRERADEEQATKFDSLVEEIAVRRQKVMNSPGYRKKAKIAEALARYPEEILLSRIDELSFDEALMLVSLVRACGGIEQDLTLEPFEWSENPLAPDSYDCRGIFKLLEKGVIAISGDTTDKAFWTDGEDIGFYFEKVRWRVAFEVPRLIREIEEVAATGAWPDRWLHEAPEVTLSFAISECLTYLSYCAQKRQLEAPQGEKTQRVFANVLRDYSVSQVYGLIWRSAANALDYLVREGVPRYQASNSMVNRIQTSADRARAEQWDIKRYSRPDDCRRTQLSHTLFDMFLSIGDRGFHERLGDVILPNGDGIF